MYRLRSILCMFLVLLMVSSICQNYAIAKSDDNTTVTPHEPKSRMSEVKKVSEKGGGGWLWGILGVVIVGGIAVALAGGGGDGDGDTSTTGEYEFTW